MNGDQDTPQPPVERPASFDRTLTFDQYIAVTAALPMLLIVARNPAIITKLNEHYQEGVIEGMQLLSMDFSKPFTEEQLPNFEIINHRLRVAGQLALEMTKQLKGLDGPVGVAQPKVEAGETPLYQVTLQQRDVVVLLGALSLAKILIDFQDTEQVGKFMSILDGEDSRYVRMTICKIADPHQHGPDVPSLTFDDASDRMTKLVVPMADWLEMTEGGK